jgi:hypothetical protein
MFVRFLFFLKQHASRFILMKFLKMYQRVKYCQVNKDCNLHIAKLEIIPRKLPNQDQNIQTSPYCVSHAVEI